MLGGSGFADRAAAPAAGRPAPAPHRTTEGLTGCPSFPDKWTLLDHALRVAPQHGLVLEFGVAAGATLSRIAAARSPAHGFDSFEGLPEDWRPGYERGRFRRDQRPEVRGAHLHVGWFADTLPVFLARHDGPLAFVHFDADLYSSTATVLSLAEERFKPGTVMLFDEYWNYPGWEQHEHRALTEFLLRTGYGVDYLGQVTAGEQLLTCLTR